MSYVPVPARVTLCTLSFGCILACGGTNIQPVPMSRCQPPTTVANVPTVNVAPAPKSALAASSRLIAPPRWLVLGTFPHHDGMPGVTRSGVDEDYLTPIGGETEAIITEEAAQQFAGERVSVVELTTDPRGRIDLDRVFEGNPDRILYAYAEVPSEVSQTAMIHFAANDSAKVWVNGQQVHQQRYSEREGNRPEQEFPVTLRAGKNRVLIKLGSGSSAFVFVPLTEADHRLAVAEIAEARFPDEELVSADGGGWVRDDSRLPGLVWSNPAFAQWALGTSALEYTWYGLDGAPVVEARAPGQYTAVVTYRSKAGVSVRRSVPLLRVGPGFLQDLDWTRPTLPKPKHLSWNEWKRVEPSVAAWAGELITREPGNLEGMAVVLGDILSPSRPVAVELGTHASMIRWQQRQLDLKRKLLGLGEPKRVAPALRSMPAPVLRPGSAQQAGIRPQSLATIRKAAADWASADQQPLVLVLARHGVIFLHESLGLHGGEPLPLSYRFRPASLGRTFAALVFAQFVEQGLLSPSQLVGEVIDRWPTQGDRAVTFRQLFDHTAGLSWHSSFRGLDNPWLEEAFIAHVLPRIKPGLYYLDEGDGNNIAAKAMELIDGRAFPILQREVLFTRLGAYSIDQWDAGWADAATAMDMAKVAQMLLQKGAYGDWQFFSEDTWKQLLPVRLAELYPNLHDRKREVGIGLEHAWDPEDEVTATDMAANQPPKRLHSLGHSPASSSIFRVDYQHDLILVAARVAAPRRRGDDRPLHGLVRALEQAVVD